MNNRSVALVLWHVKRTACLIGLWGMIAIILSCSAMYCYWFSLQQYRMEVNALREQVEIATQERKRMAERHQTESERTQLAADAVFDRLLTLDKLPSLLKEINHQATVQQLNLKEGNYQFRKVSGSGQDHVRHVSQYEMTMPVKGDYKQLRNFISRILHDTPILSISSIKLRRESVAIPEIEADLVLVVFVKES